MCVYFLEYLEYSSPLGLVGIDLVVQMHAGEGWAGALKSGGLCGVLALLLIYKLYHEQQITQPLFASFVKIIIGPTKWGPFEDPKPWIPCFSTMPNIY